MNHALISRALGSSFAVLIFLSNCSSTGLIISSLPEGAEVTSLQGEDLGKTPLTLTAEQAEKISENGLLNFKVGAPGYLPRLVYADENVSRKINVTLPKSETGTFKSEFSRDFGKDMNRMLRSAFLIQKSIGQKKYDEAKSETEAFKKEYPWLAYGHVLSAHLALLQGRREEARIDLSRAATLDPDDPGHPPEFEACEVELR